MKRIDWYRTTLVIWMEHIWMRLLCTLNACCTAELFPYWRKCKQQRHSNLFRLGDLYPSSSVDYIYSLWFKPNIDILIVLQLQSSFSNPDLSSPPPLNLYYPTPLLLPFLYSYPRLLLLPLPPPSSPPSLIYTSFIPFINPLTDTLPLSSPLSMFQSWKIYKIFYIFILSRYI